LDHQNDGKRVDAATLDCYCVGNHDAPRSLFRARRAPRQKLQRRITAPTRHGARHRTWSGTCSFPT